MHVGKQEVEEQVGEKWEGSGSQGAIADAKGPSGFVHSKMTAN